MLLWSLLGRASALVPIGVWLRWPGLVLEDGWVLSNDDRVSGSDRRRGAAGAPPGIG